MLTGAHIWAHIMRGANVERGACFRSTTRPGPTSKVYQARVVSSSKRLRTTPIPRRIAASLFAWSLATTPRHKSSREPPALHPKQPGQHVREDNGWLQSTGDITIDGSTSPILSGTACQVRAGEKHSPRNLGDDSPFWLSTNRHASERRIKTLAALPGGNPAPQKPHRADHGLPRQGARRRGHSARPATCSAMRAQGNLGFHLSARVLCRKPQFNEPSEGLRPRRQVFLLPAPSVDALNHRSL